MKVVQINAVCGTGSTGKICVAISELLTKKDVENYILYSQGDSDYPFGIKYMSTKEIRLQAIFSRVFGNYGFNSRGATKRLIAHLEHIQPDAVHLHNLHGHNCNLTMLFKYFKRKGIKLYWTFHDCWAFTGYCTHYDLIGCEKWKSHCQKCPLCKKYSWFFDRSRRLFQKKQRLFEDLDLTIITPSQWMAEQVRCSFLKDYPVKVINNGIDLELFQPCKSDFRQRYNISADKKILLGVANGWGYPKGLDIFIELAKRLDSEKFQIVLVGTDESVEGQLPANIISIRRTNNQKELAEIYTAADVFVNPTREDTFPTVNIEALACGTPVVTFKTGGSTEIVDESCGCAVTKNDVDSMEQVCKNLSRESGECRARTLAYEVNNKFNEYLNLYTEEKY